MSGRPLLVLRPAVDQPCRENRMHRILETALTKCGVAYQVIETAQALSEIDLTNRALLFAVALSEEDVNLEAVRMLAYFRKSPDCLSGSVAGVVVDGGGELSTKAVARELIFTANGCGCLFPGKPLVEATGSLANFQVMAGLQQTDLLGAYQNQVLALVEKVTNFSLPKMEVPKILMVHAGNRRTSNTLLLWDQIREQLGEQVQVTEVSLRNGEVLDCRGCSYESCVHLGEQADCFYGGVIVEQAYPALLQADTIVMVCPNYNDSVGANILAFINRLSALYRANDFSSKRVFAIVVSGYSGGDLVAQQILGAMNCNKNMILPPKFALLETANDPGSILQVPGIQERIRLFATGLLP